MALTCLAYRVYLLPLLGFLLQLERPPAAWPRASQLSEGLIGDFEAGFQRPHRLLGAAAEVFAV